MPSRKQVLTIICMEVDKNDRHFNKSHVGTGSSTDDLRGDFCKILFTSVTDKQRKEHLIQRDFDKVRN
jgi:hypothetical protein